MRRSSKKGISTVLAAIFIAAIITVGLNAMSSSLNLQNNFAQVVTEKNIRETERVSESLEIRDVKISNYKLNMTVANTGTVPVRLVNMWVTNTTSITGWHKNYTLNEVVNPGDTLFRLGTSLPVVAKNSSSYKINIVTERGSSASFHIISPTERGIYMSLFVLPRSVPSGQNVTIQFGVTNNITDGSILHAIKPQISWTATEVAGGTTTANAELMEGPLPPIAESLTLGETVFFKWVYKVTGDEKDKLNFNATITNAKQGNYVRESSEIVFLQSHEAVTQNVLTQITTNSGILTMNFTTFEFCRPTDPPAQDCTSDSPDWAPGWKVNDDTKYIWRVNITNNGDKNILLEKDSSILLLHVQDAAGGNIPTAIYIKADSTPTVEDAGAYTDFDKVLLKPDEDGKGRPVTLYFGSDDPGAAPLEEVPTDGLYAVNLVLFGYEDANDDGDYTVGIDTIPYSQNIPFQGLFAT
jgi:hypothetical protein